jgi:hypothetical protein
VDLPALADAERAFLRALGERGVRFLVMGMGAAVLQGATAVTQDLDLWFEDLSDPRPKDLAQIPILEAAIAVRDEPDRRA